MEFRCYIVRGIRNYIRITVYFMIHRHNNVFRYDERKQVIKQFDISGYVMKIVIKEIIFDASIRINCGIFATIS